MNTGQKWEVSQDLSTSIMYVNEMKDHPQKTSYLLHLFNDEPNCGVF